MITKQLNKEERQAMLVWAQSQLDAMPQSDYEGDWWGVYDDEWVINIWDSQSLGDRRYDQPTRATAYLMMTDGQTNYDEYVSIGFIQEPVEWHYDESCDECGEPMRGKGDGSRPTRYEGGYAHGSCVVDAEKLSK